MATRKPDPAISISVERKLMALGAKLASAPIANGQRTVLKFAPSVVESPALFVMTEELLSQILATLPEVDPMILARSFMAQEPNSVGLTPQQLYSASPVFWSTAGSAAGQIALIKCPDNLYRASGLLSIVARAASGFTDHLYQVVGKSVDGVQLIKPTLRTPGLPKSVFQGTGVNGDFILTLLSGIVDPESDLPSITVKAGKTADAADNSDPFADLDGWLD